MITIQKQTWLTRTIYLLTTEGGSVQLSVFKKQNDAFIHNLWVDEPHRRKGIATALLDAAEEIARHEGQKFVRTYWRDAESPDFMYDYYRRRGYEDDCKTDEVIPLTLTLK